MSLRLLIPLGVVIAALATLNAYVEEWRYLEPKNLKQSQYLLVSSALLLVFLSAYTRWTLHLRQQCKGQMITSNLLRSFLPVVYVLCFSVALLLPQIRSTETLLSLFFVLLP